MKDAVFYFQFEGSSGKHIATKGFIIKAEGVNKIVAYHNVANFDDFSSDTLYDDYTSHVEEYGVHDWSSSPDDRVFGIGFTSYEVKKSQIDKLLNEWRKMFIEVAGEENVGKIVDVRVGDMANDYDVYQDIKHNGKI